MITVEAGQRHGLEPFIVRVREQFRGFPEHEPESLTGLEPEQLRAIGLPPRPSSRQPRLRELWDEALGHSPRRLEYKLDVERLLTQDVEPWFREADGLGLGASHVLTSRNWSGATITATRDLPLVQVWGSWVMPDLTSLPTNEPTALSMWVGLDGQRRYFDSSLPQIGTTATLQADGTVALSAWTQWWSRESDVTLPVPIVDFPLGPGHRVVCAVTVLDPKTVLMLIVNVSVSPHAAMPIFAQSPQVARHHGLVEQPSITGVTAQWVLERPRIAHKPDFVRFPDYTPTEIDFCGAVAGPTVDFAGVLAGQARDLLDSRLLRMFDVEQGPPRTRLISMAAHHDEFTIKLHHGGFPH